ncbi:hypothetical protein OESDEN_10761 [Oesophagostomum dentatum]|uniref:Uncharacterized protein n=1 Tax=Oesophagostomum dentatum TaxID=61180 RepID=A0A0B1SZR4_OESDE|nr:hypothetical protein OESDEN_10761 [Oesophagostomum dentatum]
MSNRKLVPSQLMRLLDFWQKKDSLMVKLWIEDLKSAGYEFPAMVDTELSADDCWDSSDNNVRCSPAHIELSTDIPAIHTKKALKRMKQKVKYAEELHEWCREAIPGGPLKTFTYDYLAEKHSQNQSLVENLGKVLVVVIDQGGAGIGVLQRLYEPYFAVVIFCGKGDFIRNAKKCEPSCKTAYKLITEKYGDDEDVQQMWTEYQQGLSTHNGHVSASKHIQVDVGYADSMFIYIPSDKITYFSRLVQIFDEAKIPEGFAVSKFLDTIEVEWLPPMTNPLTNNGKVDTRKLLAANPTRYTHHTELEERKLFCTTIVTTFRRVLLDIL